MREVARSLKSLADQGGSLVLMYSLSGQISSHAPMLTSCFFPSDSTILSVSRYTAHLEEQKAHDAQIQMQIETGTATSEAQAAAEPTAQILNSDAKFEAG